MRVAIYFNDAYHDEHLAAYVTVPDDWDDIKALEHAYARTQNIMGSWSQGSHFEDGTRNDDYASDITVLKPLHRGLEGQLIGLRSTMVGDVFVITEDDPSKYMYGWPGRPFYVAPRGFSPCPSRKSDA